MKEKDLRMSLLLDYYGNVLTGKQKEVVELYYNQDLSLAEIAELTQISRQGVRDCIKRGEAAMLFMEERLGLAEKSDRLRRGLEKIGAAAAAITQINERYCFSKDIGKLAEEIERQASELCDE